MIETLDRIAELRELQTLYHNGELCNFDFETRIQRLERQVDQFERENDAYDMTIEEVTIIDEEIE